ncbi:hypothetical protein BDK51DRAFT_30675 [Blyttiomyces helicus]|uniref:Galactose oxidase n=1 Tax=Blyttiomyces helicus TaxID=388810 RepID=A0A4P9WGD1_9FUNG|nr:hypothetical protein BDK51DRAFT_30675 [Blyttiomyces helicus]|eukprot:RKO91869.1 hypothetical protein BDK51DRAFT_30675 [Blyttiomyces helicus]
MSTTLRKRTSPAEKDVVTDPSAPETTDSKAPAPAATAKLPKVYPSIPSSTSYDLIANFWNTAPPQPASPLHHSAVFVVGAKIYCVGGLVAPQIYSTATQIFDTASNTWSQGVPYIGPGISNAGAAAVAGCFWRG